MANAAALLAAIDGTQAAPMTFPNVTLAVDAVRQINALIYFEKNAVLSTVTVDDQSVATARIEGNNVVITGKAAGQTTAVVKAGSVEQKFVISVRNTNSGNGWL